VHIKNKHLLNAKGPLLIISNHPNSFFDAIVIGAYYHRRVYFLARGDVFKKPIHRFLLNLLHIIPIYRLREGKEFLHLNEYAFIKSVELLNKGEAVLIFIEGICLNTNDLQPFKKGTSRILERCHAINVFPKLHIAGIAYNHFRGIGKKINLIFTEIEWNSPIISAQERIAFNKEVFTILQQNIIAPHTNSTTIKKNGWYYIHKTYYQSIYQFVARKTKGTVFFDSVLFSVLLFTYPLFLFLIYLILHFLGFTLPIILIILVGLPLMSKTALH
jgi:1-acyl-sn-glycerol-3-phosphate acyltransferase